MDAPTSLPSSDPIQDALAVLDSMIPSVDNYRNTGVPQDLWYRSSHSIVHSLRTGLQKRDFKWKFALNVELISDLQEHLLPTHLLPIQFEEAEALLHNNPTQTVSKQF